MQCLCVHVRVCVYVHEVMPRITWRTSENSAVEFCETSTPETDLYRAVPGEESWVIAHNPEAKRWSPE